VPKNCHPAPLPWYCTCCQWKACRHPQRTYGWVWINFTPSHVQYSYMMYSSRMGHKISNKALYHRGHQRSVVIFVRWTLGRWGWDVSSVAHWDPDIRSRGLANRELRRYVSLIRERGGCRYNLQLWRAEPRHESVPGRRSPACQTPPSSAVWWWVGKKISPLCQRRDMPAGLVLPFC
jgi:hypothetical protein